MATDGTELADRTQIVDLLSRYFSAVDDKCLCRATVDATFTMDGRLVRPNGTALVGREAIFCGQSESFARFHATHHVITDHVVDLDGDAARLRANLTAMHLWSQSESDPNSLERHFVAGGVLRALAARTDEGWRLSELALRNTWRTGAGQSAMARTGTPER